MSFAHILDPVYTSILSAAAIGSAVFVSLRRNLGWSAVLSIFFVNLALAFYVTIPFATWRGWSMAAYTFIAFCIGLFGFLLSGAALNLLQSLHDNPQGTLDWARTFWRGGSGPEGGAKS